MNRLGISRQLPMLLTLLVVTIMVIVGVNAYLESGATQASSALTKRIVDNDQRIFDQLQELAEMQNSVQRLLREDDADKLDKLVSDYKTRQKNLSQRLAAEGEASKDLAAHYAAWSKCAEQVIHDFLQGNAATANNRLITQLTPQFEAILKILGTEQDQLTAETERDLAAHQKTMVQTRMWTLVVTGGVIVVLAGFTALMTRRMLRQIRATAGTLGEASDALAAVADQVATASQSLSTGASQQAASLEETSSSLEEFTGQTRATSEHAGRAQTTASAARTAADTGEKRVRHMVDVMGAVSESSNQIARILKTIDEIAFQTNLLALNAAVEAARAGSAGAGFAVVAAEVRTLAQRSSAAATETAAIIQQAIEKTQQGLTASQDVGHSLQDILSRAHEVDQLVTEIATAAKEQSAGVGQINTALAQVGQVTQTNAAAATDTAAAADKLRSQAATMAGAVGDLRQLLDGGRRVAAG